MRSSTLGPTQGTSLRQSMNLQQQINQAAVPMRQSVNMNDPNMFQQPAELGMPNLRTSQSQLRTSQQYVNNPVSRMDMNALPQEYNQQLGTQQPPPNNVPQTTYAPVNQPQVQEAQPLYYQGKEATGEEDMMAEAETPKEPQIAFFCGLCVPIHVTEFASIIFTFDRILSVYGFIISLILLIYFSANSAPAMLEYINDSSPQQHPFFTRKKTQNYLIGFLVCFILLVLFNIVNIYMTFTAASSFSATRSDYAKAKSYPIWRYVTTFFAIAYGVTFVVFMSFFGKDFFLLSYSQLLLILNQNNAPAAILQPLTDAYNIQADYTSLNRPLDFSNPNDVELVNQAYKDITSINNSGVALYIILGIIYLLVILVYTVWVWFSTRVIGQAILEKQRQSAYSQEMQQYEFETKENAMNEALQRMTQQGFNNQAQQEQPEEDQQQQMEQYDNNNYGQQQQPVDYINQSYNEQLNTSQNPFAISPQSYARPSYQQQYLPGGIGSQR